MSFSSSSHDVAITVEGLGKQYRLGQREPYKTVRSSVTNLLKKNNSSNAEERHPLFWALRDISFDVGQGEAIGIIGHNGAGKSTLLKLLARVTAPTEGRASLHGRVSALLEVGTGFHPELTGRENVHLNGSILGMRQTEIRKKFDQIVEFSETGKFIDTQIKRYSSGMQVRLAFSIAAFLEPEILIVDEVLAVGDVAFQRKCLGQLSETKMEGRTVVFVSHNLPAVRMLCQRSILLNHGSLVFDGPTGQAIDRYVDSTVGNSREWELENAERPKVEMRNGIILERAFLIKPDDTDTVPVGSQMEIRVEFDVTKPTKEAVLVLDIFTLEDVWVAQSVSTSSHRPFNFNELGHYGVDLLVESAALQPGRYAVGFSIRSSQGLEDWTRRGGMVEFIESEDIEFPWFSSTNGYLRLAVKWSVPTRTDSRFGHEDA
jgi:lipopolysaccharide transport system ATP-binding protein